MAGLLWRIYNDKLFNADATTTIAGFLLAVTAV
jgi:hypothetical protein